ncbi:hypothetical protein [Paenarthrobacter ureafaciens]|uniref:hypothetical protein n=1 Tax=Paenarthrobacter TaxID=1742992 RepID=UPI0029C9E70A|nr:hypothetical protein [Paenarthrobacter ureafaciens]
MTVRANQPEQPPAEKPLQGGGVPRELGSPAQLRFTAAGAPLAVRFDGQVWPVAAEPVHWFTRWDWWNQKVSAAVGVGDLVSVEHWRLQVRGGSSSALRTVHVRRNPQETEWHVVAISDVGEERECA